MENVTTTLALTEQLYKNFHLEKSGKKSLGPTFVPMDSGCKKDCQIGEWVNLEQKENWENSQTIRDLTKCGRLVI